MLSGLEGEAKEFIISMDAQLHNASFDELFTIMDKRFGYGSKSQHYQALLESLFFKPGDNLRTYLDEVRRLVTLSYPEIPDWMQREGLVKKHFVNGIQDYGLKQKLLIDPPATAQDAIQYAERYITTRASLASQKRLFKDRLRMVRPCEEDCDTDDELDTDLIKYYEKKHQQRQEETKRIYKMLQLRWYWTF